MKKMVWKFWLLVVVSSIITFVAALGVGCQRHEEHNVFLELDVKHGLFYRDGSQFAINYDFPQAVTFSYSRPFSELKSFPYVQFKDAVVGPFDDVRLEIRSGEKILANVPHVNGSGLMFNINWDKVAVEENAPIELKFNVVYGSDIGMTLPERKDITFNGLFLQTDSLTSRWQYLISWFNHQPSYHLYSMNFWQKQGMPMSLAIAFIIWLTVVLVIGMWVLRVPMAQLLLLLFLMTVPVYLSVITKQLSLKSQISSIFDNQESDDSINSLDRNMQSFAMVFNKIMSNHSGTKMAVVVKISQAFEQSRMVYHLKEWNVIRSIYWHELLPLKKNKHLNELYVVFSESRVPECQAKILLEHSDAEILMSQNGYCVVKL